VIIAYQTLRSAQESLDQVTELAVPAMIASHEMEINVVETGLKVLRYIESGDAEYRTGALEDMADFDRFHARYAQLARTPNERELAEKVRLLFAEYRALGLQLMDKADANRALTHKIESGQRDRQMRPHASTVVQDTRERELARFLALRTELDDLLDESIQAYAVAQLSQAQEAARAAQTAQTKALHWLIALIVLSAVLALLAAARLIRAVSHPVQELVHAAKAFGAGRLDHRLPELGDPDLDQAAAGFNRMAAQLQETMVSRDKLAASEARFRGILDAMEEGYYEVDLRGNIQFCNRGLERQFGCAPGELIGVNSRQLTDEANAQKIYETFNMVYRTGKSVLLEVEAIHPDGGRHDISASVQIMRDASGVPIGFRGLQYDTTERKRAERTLAHQTLHDVLTDLPNRTLLHDRLEQAVLAAARDYSECALLILDLDNFKEINDALGHAAGDALLRMIAPRLRNCIRDADTLARLGGDEFAIVLPSADALRAERVARKILETLAATFDIEGTLTQINVSIGIAQYPQHGESSEDLLRRADVAMYNAKHDHSGYALYLPERDPHRLGHLALSGELRRALERDELTLYYQPQLRLRDCALAGMEALVRWQHPQRGLLLPQDFIPLAERRGLIQPLTLWTIECAARQSAEWRAQGLEVSIAINLSPMLLRNAVFIGEVLALLDSHDNAGAWLELEVTEQALMHNAHSIQAHLRALRARGVRLAIDHFGTGYSSLTCLREFLADTLKIDRSFAHNVATDENNALIVRAIIQLAHSLGIHVIAEGVENQESCDRLHAFGCDAAQGYHLGAPMPAAECLPWVDALLLQQDPALGT